jgi:hypothetical protein
MLRVRFTDTAIAVGPHREISFQRTLRIPADDGVYPLPPGLGRFPLCPATRLGERAPEDWRRRGGAVLPMYQREALWLSFDGAWWRPSAIKVAVGGVNALTGEPLDLRIEPRRQDYLVCPDQPWLDGVKSADGEVRQFVAAALGHGHTVEEQLTGGTRGGIQIVVIEPRPGLFPETAPARGDRYADEMVCCSMPAPPDMGLGAGGRMRQEVYPDDYGWETWDPTSATQVEVRICAAAAWPALTGEHAPPTPVDAAAYTSHGLPWFDLYAERGDLPGVGAFAGLRPVPGDDAPLSVPPWQVNLLGEPAAEPA